MKYLLSAVLLTVLTVATPFDKRGETYDYIVVGSGAAGLVAADRLSETGKKVLLIERGPPSTWEHGGRRGPEWTVENQLTRFDVPGLCNQVWVDSTGIACTDVQDISGCILGGGTAINAGLFFKPADKDFDAFPTGWKPKDITPAINKVFSRIPSTTTPSTDGKRHQQESYDVLSTALSRAGWRAVDPSTSRNDRHRTFVHSPFQIIGGERGGPLATYLRSAKKRKNFKLILNTSVERVIRKGGKATGVELAPYKEGGVKGTVSVNSKGKIILAAGAFGTAKILLRSGIGRKDQLDIVKKSSDGKNLPPQKDWINLPVGENLLDHTNTDLVASHPNVVHYDWIGAYENPVPADKEAYLTNRTGVLTQSAPAVNTIFWETFKGRDGITRSVQWSARAEGSLGTTGEHTITLASNLGTGMTSKGKMTINPDLTMSVAVQPHLRSEHDVEAIINAVSSLVNDLNASGTGITFDFPANGMDAESYVRSYTASRRSNHWMGSARMGTDDGRKGGNSVVDTDTKVYGTDNLYVVDASIFPQMVTHNPSATIMVVAERAVEKILGK